jgi:hypothetical protein
LDEAVKQMCSGPRIELGCGPGRLVARLNHRGVTALGIRLESAHDVGPWFGSRVAASLAAF